MREHIIAVDVGTGSARAGVFRRDGEQLSRAVAPIVVHQPAPRHFEQNSEDIWRAVTQSVLQARHEAGLEPEDVAAIGFDATCSLVFRDADGQPVGISASGGDGFDTMLWMDHRAAKEADECSLPGHAVVKRYGGRLSPEMQAPKLLWLKRQLPERWKRAGKIFDLCDFLTWRATGSNARSHSSLASKWGYEPCAPGAYPADFYAAIGLADLRQRSAIPLESHELSRAVGNLAAGAASDLGLTADCVVAPGLIDAYAGAAGASGMLDQHILERSVALVAGTSSCLISLSLQQIEPRPGCWGGFRDVAVSGYWLLEAGQSASGALLDFVLRNHPAGGEPSRALHLRVLDHIERRLISEGYRYGLPVSVLPDFHGTRAPVTDATLTGTIAGLSLDATFDGLCQIYWRTCVGLACGISEILHQMPHAEKIDDLCMTGGFSNHQLIAGLYANATGRNVLLGSGRDAVLSGTAMHAGLAAGLFASQTEASRLFAREGKNIRPDPRFDADIRRDLDIYRAMVRQRDELRNIRAVHQSNSQGERKILLGSSGDG